MFRRKKPRGTNDLQSEQSNTIFEMHQLNTSLALNVNQIMKIFNNDDTLKIHEFENQLNDNIKGCIIFIDGMVDIKIINENIIKPIITNEHLIEDKHLVMLLKQRVIISNDMKKTYNFEEAEEAIINGDTILLLEGYNEALIIRSVGWESRAIEEPQVEKALRGPREGFTESIMVNLTLIRRRVKTSKLKFKFKTIGTVTNTKLCLCYIEGIVNVDILREVEKRIDELVIDGVLDTGYIQELIKDTPMSPFETIGSTERPDVVVGKILEGRIGIILDGTPVALTAPYMFIEYFQTNEDYYNNYYFSIVGRMLRVLGFMLTISIPAIYIALTSFHQEMIPTPLIISIAAARQGIPLPTTAEAIGLLIVFEILRETGTRMPSYMGQALSIVGALVIGQAAVEARFVSAPIVIVIAFSGITGLMVPKIKGAVIFIRTIFILFASFLGFYGFAFGVIGLLLHLFEIRSFGVPYMANLSTFDPQEFKDTFIRAPWWYMKYRPKFIATANRKRYTQKRND